MPEPAPNLSRQLQSWIELNGSKAPIAKPFGQGYYMLTWQTNEHGDDGVWYWLDECEQHGKWFSLNQLALFWTMLQHAGAMDVDAFKLQFPQLADDGVCHFYCMRGVLVQLGLAESQDRGVRLLLATPGKGDL